MPRERLAIVPTTKVSELLEEYPELEDFLIIMAPPFKKLRNPVLRRSVAKVASLRQAAAVAGMPVEELINALRAEVGQETMYQEQLGEVASYLGEQPDWFDEELVVASLDDRASKDSGRMTVLAVLEKSAQLNQTEIVELVTTFVPAPGIDLMKKKGFQAWCVRRAPDLFKSYFTKAAQPSQTDS